MSIPVVGSARFKVGKYDIVAQPIPHSAHMLRYTVFLFGTRIGALVSLPTESDCRFLEKPPVVPPLKIYQLKSRPGRRKKDSRPPANFEGGPVATSGALPPDVSLAGMPKPEDR